MVAWWRTGRGMDVSIYRDDDRRRASRGLHNWPAEGGMHTCMHG